jgi:hypothetical protein
VTVTASNFSRTVTGLLTVRIRFDLALTNRLQHSALVTPTFPAPPAGGNGVLLFPFRTIALGANGQPVAGVELRARASVDWNGAPHSFFNSASCGILLGDDCFRWESYGTPIAPSSTTPARTVGFDTDAEVRQIEVFALVAADIREETAPVRPIVFAGFMSADGFEIYRATPMGAAPHG